MTALRRWLGAGVVVLGVASCVPPRFVKSDAGTEAADAGAPLVFSIGITDGADFTHDVAPFLLLSFETGNPGPDTVLARRAVKPPILDGLDSDWASVAGSQVPLQPGAAVVGMSIDEWNTSEWRSADGAPTPYDFGIGSALVKSTFDDTDIYFLIQWVDATQNTAKNTLTFNGSTWARNTEGEDRLFFSFDVDFPDFATLGCSAACHIRERLDDTSDAGIAFRKRMHANAPGELVDVWSWGSVSTNPMLHADDIGWNEVTRVSDTDAGFSSSNRKTLSDGGIEPRFMSEYGVNSNPDVLYVAGLGLHPEAVPFNPTELDAGARIPGVVHQMAKGSRGDVQAAGKWRNGKWTVELKRARVTGDPNDTQF